MAEAVAERRWMSWEQAADYAGVDKRTLQRLASEGRLPTSRPRAGSGPSGRTLIDRLDLDKLLEEAKRTADLKG